MRPTQFGEVVTEPDCHGEGRWFEFGRSRSSHLDVEMGSRLFFPGAGEGNTARLQSADRSWQIWTLNTTSPEVTS